VFIAEDPVSNMILIHVASLYHSLHLYIRWLRERQPFKQSWSHKAVSIRWKVPSFHLLISFCSPKSWRHFSLVLIFLFFFFGPPLLLLEYRGINDVLCWSVPVLYIYFPSRIGGSRECYLDRVFLFCLGNGFVVAVCVMLRLARSDVRGLLWKQFNRLKPSGYFIYHQV
jgi:hypothetical protein